MQNGVQLTVTVKDYDPGNDDDLVEIFRFWLGGSPPHYVANKAQNGAYDNGRLSVRYRVWCNSGWRGSNCNIGKYYYDEELG